MEDKTCSRRPPESSACAITCCRSINATVKLRTAGSSCLIVGTKSYQRCGKSYWSGWTNIWCRLHNTQTKMSNTKRVSVQAGYDLWSETYDATPNPVVAMDARHTVELL